MKDKTVIAVLLTIIIALIVVTVAFNPIKSEHPYIVIERVNAKIKNVNYSSVSIEFILSMYSNREVKNATLITSVYDEKTRLLLEELKKNFSGKGDFTVTMNSSFSRLRSYIVKFTVLKHPEAMRGLILTNLNELTPPNNELMVNLKSMDFRILNVSNNKVRVCVEMYFQPWKAYNNVTFHIKAIQYESKVLADEKWIHNVNLTPERTEILRATLVVPDKYNYLIVVEAWRNGFLVKSWKNVLNLNPEKPVKNVTQVNFSSKKFIKPLPQPIPRTVPKKTPGFEVFVALLVLVLTCWRFRRERKN